MPLGLLNAKPKGRPCGASLVAPHPSLVTTLRLARAFWPVAISTASVDSTDLAVTARDVSDVLTEVSRIRQIKTIFLQVVPGIN